MSPAPPQIEDVLALSPLQEGLFALYRLAEDSIDLYSMQFIVDVDGPVDFELLRRSAQAMLWRHPNLRSAFWDRDVPQPVAVIPVDAELPWSERIAMPTEFESIARSERRRPFDLSRGPALRVVLLTVPGETRRRMIFTAHHILVDGWALAVFFAEMLAVYRAGGSADALPAPRPYRDYILWLAGQDKAAAIAKWNAYLDGVSGPLMVADGSSVETGLVPEKTHLLLSRVDTTRLREWAGRNGLTLNTAVLFAWAVVLSRLTDRRDVVFGTIVSGRPEQLPGVQTMVGLFINVIPVVHNVSRTVPVVEQCARLQRESSAMRDISYLSLSELQREHGCGTLFDSLFVFENAPIEDAIRPVAEPDGTCFSPIEMESLTHYPLTVVSHLQDDALVVLIEAIRQALPHLRPEEIGERLLAVLRQLPDIGDKTPDALNILTAAEQAEFAGSAAQLPAAGSGTVWETFASQARATPDAVALTTSAGDRYTYAELHADACRLASELAQHGVGPESVVALALPRSAKSVVAILAVLGAGAAYLPVDIALPPGRIESLLRQADPVLAITTADYSHLIAAPIFSLVLDDPVVVERVSKHVTAAPTVRRHPEHCAYVIFTSGSTGEPKGVIGTNAAILSYFADHRERVYRAAVPRLGRPLRIAHAWSLSFDASWQPMIGLLDGHAIHLFDAEEMRDADRLVKGMAASQIDMIDTTPSMLVQLRAAGLLDRPLEVLALGGEAINTALWEELQRLSPTTVFNCYGPTEVTVEAVVARVQDYPTPTIGTANAGTCSYVLDSALRMVPNGVMGELYLSGAQLARGYVGRSAMTAGRFVADPFRPGDRMYRTGDLVRRLQHGGFAYLGRADTQVKIRGYRVEIGEIEAALRGYPDVHDAAVTVLSRGGTPSLVGFVVWQQGIDGDLIRLRTALSERLPLYMVPARIVELPALPVNANGKLDGHRLHGLAETALSTITAEGAATPSTDTERLVGEVFREQFNGLLPHIDDDFFSLGLDSIVAISLVHKARRRGLRLSPRMVFTAPTIRQLAAAIDEAADPEVTVESAEYGDVLPLPMVSWLFEYGNYRRFTHTVLLRMPAEIDRESIESVLQTVLDGHDTLRSILVDTSDGPRLTTREPGIVRAADLLTRMELPNADDVELISALTQRGRSVADEIDPHQGAMMRSVWFSGAQRGEVLLITAHHLAVDVVSWHIMLGEIAEAWRSVRTGSTPKTLPEFTSYRRWSELMWERARTPEVQAQREYWAAQVRAPDPALGTRHPDATRDTWSTLRVTPVTTSVDDTERVLSALGRDGGIRELLLAATLIAVSSMRRERGQDRASGTLIALEGHGRADGVVDTDTTNTVGWFTTAFPVRLGAGRVTVDIDQVERDPRAGRALLDSVTEHLATIPNEGLDYGLLRYVDRAPELQQAPEPAIQFGYLGRLDLGGGADQGWSLLTRPYVDALPVDPEPDLPLRFALNLSVLVGASPQGPQLISSWRWSDALFTRSDIDRLTEFFQRGISALAAVLD